MNETTPHPRNTTAHRDFAFMIGLAAGTVVGAAMMLWLAPRTAAELRQRVSASARSLSKRATDQFERANAHVGEAVDTLARKGKNVRNDVADAVARGAHNVERLATAARSDRAE